METYFAKVCKISVLTVLLCFLFLYGALGEDNAGKTAEPHPVNNPAAIVTNLHADFRNGQVFIGWDESADNGRNLRVYVSREPVNSQNFASAQLLTDQLEPHSANDWYDDPAECPRATGPAHGWIIEPAHQAIDRRGGLFVHTVKESDPKSAYFAVLGEQEDEANLKIGINSLQKPVAISVGEIQAIWQLQGAPTPARGKPLAVSLHSHLSRPSGQLNYLYFGDSNMGWREGLPFKFKVSVRPATVLLEPYDRVWINRKMTVDEAKANGTYDTQYKNIESWWYGTNSKINTVDFITSDGVPTNYTERCILWEMNWIHQNYQTDANKVYAFGASMGTGILRLVLQNPARFASADLLVPILDPFGEENVGRRMAPRVGDPQSTCSDGVRLMDRLNTINEIKAAKSDLPPIVIRMGRSDVSAFWTRKPAFIKAVQDQKQALFAGWDNGTHHTAMRKPVAGFPNWFDFKWHIRHFAINKSYPVFTGFSLDNDPGNGDVHVGDTIGFINRGLDWKVIKDSKSEYRILIKENLPRQTYPMYVNVTPRRLQKFTPNKATVHASNIGPDGKVTDTKELNVDNGLVTCAKFAITSPVGNTLLIQN